MKVKVEIPVILQDGNTATVTLDAELEAQILGTTGLAAEVKQINNPVIRIVEDNR